MHIEWIGLRYRYLQPTAAPRRYDIEKVQRNSRGRLPSGKGAGGIIRK